MRIAGSIDISEISTINDVIKISIVVNRIKKIYTDNLIRTNIENDIFEDRFIDDMLEDILDVYDNEMYKV